MAKRPDYRSEEAKAYRHWYWTSRWRRLRAAQLTAHPLCARCLAQGTVTPATVANHVIPHKGDEVLFWEGQLESSCKPHHDGVIQAEEARGYAIGNGSDGRPIDPGHPWNRR